MDWTPSELLKLKKEVELKLQKENENNDRLEELCKSFYLAHPQYTSLVKVYFEKLDKIKPLFVKTIHLEQLVYLIENSKGSIFHEEYKIAKAHFDTTTDLFQNIFWPYDYPPKVVRWGYEIWKKDKTKKDLIIDLISFYITHHQ